MTTDELVAFLRGEAASWEANFGQEWAELRIAAEVIQRLKDALHDAGVPYTLIEKIAIPDEPRG